MEKCEQQSSERRNEDQYRRKTRTERSKRTKRVTSQWKTLNDRQNITDDYGKKHSNDKNSDNKEDNTVDTYIPITTITAATTTITTTTTETLIIIIILELQH